MLDGQATPQKTFDPRAFYVYGPKIIAMRNSFDDQALESRFLTEEMGQRPMRAGIPINLPDRCDEEAHELRSRLLGYRFEALDSTGIVADVHEESLSPRANQTMAPLLSVVPDRSLKEHVLSAMHAAEEAVQAERAASVEGQLLAVLLSMDLRRGPATVGRIADVYRSRYGGDADRPISPRYIGCVLRNRLHLVPVKRHGVYILDERHQMPIDALVRRYGFEIPQDSYQSTH